MIDSGEPYITMQSPAHTNPITEMRKSPSIVKRVTRKVKPKNPTSKKATHITVFA